MVITRAGHLLYPVKIRIRHELSHIQDGIRAVSVYFRSKQKDPGAGIIFCRHLSLLSACAFLLITSEEQFFHPLFIESPSQSCSFPSVIHLPVILRILDVLEYIFVVKVEILGIIIVFDIIRIFVGI